MPTVRSLRLIVALLLVAGVTLLVGAQSGLADPELPDIPAHRHYVEAPNGKLVEVGPRVCDDASLQEAFNQFHSNVHHAVPGSTGPTQSAPGLHNHKGADIVASGCGVAP